MATATDVGQEEVSLPHVYLRGEVAADEFRGLWEYAAQQTSEGEPFVYCRKSESSAGSSVVTGSWEGWFALRGPKQREHRIYETFELWLTDKSLGGAGANQYGTFSLLGSFDGTNVVLERYYQNKIRPKKAKPKPVDVPSDRPKRDRKPKRAHDDVFSAFEEDDDVVELPTKKRPKTSSSSGGVEEDRRKKKKKRKKLLLDDVLENDKKKTLTTTTTEKKREKTTTEKATKTKKKKKTLPPFSSSSSSSKKKKKKRRKHGSGFRRGDCLTYTLQRKFEEDAGGLYSWCWAVVDGEEAYEGTRDRETGLRHGVGTCVSLKHGYAYRGEWRFGREHGRGVVLDAKTRDVLYVGEFADGKVHGSGVAFCGRQRDGRQRDAYAGDVRENARHGRGSYFADSFSYDGEWRDGAKHGRGSYFAEFSSYVGDFVKDERHGRGTLRLQDGTSFEGFFAHDALEGRGRCCYSDGQTYAGIFKRGLKEGRGNLVFRNGAQYEGRFRADAIDGQGALYVPRPVPLLTASSSRPLPPEKKTSSSRRKKTDLPPPSPRTHQQHKRAADDDDDDAPRGWLVPIQLKSDISKIHLKAGFDDDGR